MVTYNELVKERLSTSWPASWIFLSPTVSLIRQGIGRYSKYFINVKQRRKNLKSSLCVNLINWFVLNPHPNWRSQEDPHNWHTIITHPTLSGTHYYYNMTPDLKCDDLLPWFALSSRGDLVGTGFQTFGKLGSKKPGVRDWFERLSSPKTSTQVGFFIFCTAECTRR